MGSSLLLDCAYPPVNVADWIATLRMAGASGCMAYIYDLQIPGNRWTPGYCRAIQDAGYSLLAVYVWGPTYPVIGHVRDVAAAYGITSGPIMGDIEAGSMPSEAYFSGWCSDLRNNGYVPVAYGTASTLDSYRRYADKGYLASYIQRQLQPIPDLAGVSYDGWQYANSFQINGVEVDASVTTIPLIGGDDLTTDQAAQLQRVHDLLFGVAVPNAPLPTPPYEANAYDLVRDVKLALTGSGPLDPHAATVIQHLNAAEASLAALKGTPDPAVLAVVNRIEAALKQA